MKRNHSMSSLVTVISLFFSVIWLSPTLAVAAPTFTSLGQITASAMRVPGAMDLDASGNLYVADARGGMVHKFNPYGLLLQSFDLHASGRGLAVTPDGRRLYVARETTVVIADALSGTELGALAGEVTFSMVGEIDLDAVGNVFVADVKALRINVYAPSGQYLANLGSSGTNAGQFMQIGGLAVNPTGQLVVADSSSLNNKVHVFTLGANLQVLNVTAYANATAAHFGAPVMHAPRGLAFDSQGRAYFLEFFTSQVRVTSADFGYLGAYTQAGYAAGQLNNVIDAIYDNANNRLFVGCDTGRIVILGVEGGQVPVNVNHAPTVPTQQSPVAGSEVASLTPTLTINNATDADGDALTYEVVISQSDTVVYQEDVAAMAGEVTTHVVGMELTENVAYSWTVQATDGKASSAVSAAANFVVNAVEEAPTAPELSAPVNGESIDGSSVLTWTASTDPDPNDLNISYLIEVALDADFTRIVATESSLATELTLGAFAAYGDLVDGAGYFWRVVAQDDSQTTSAPSIAKQFVYDTTCLTITANMPDAVVSFHGNHAYAGKTIGIAPIGLDFTPGTLSVVVERAGFEPFVAQVTLADGENVELYAALVPAMNVKNLNNSNNGINGRSGLSVSGSAAPFLVDFDNDGDLDLLAGDGSGQVMLFANLRIESRNRLSFDQGVSLGLSVMPGAVPFVADWNNDGRKDLLVGQVDGSVKLFLNTGLEEAPAFAAAFDIQTGGGVLNVGGNAAPAVMDYDDDGRKDLLIGNDAGAVVVYLNQGTDASPLFSEATTVIEGLTGAVVPMPVDWDADGRQELMLTADGAVTVYHKTNGEYQAGQQFSDRRNDYNGAFPIDLEGSGKQLLVGQSDGQIIYLTGNSTELVSSFHLAMQDKVDELASLVAEEAPQLLSDVASIGALVGTADYPEAALAAELLAFELPAGSAQTAALELVELCQ